MRVKGAQSFSTTPFPNLLLDQLMPSLKDTEWRLLCVVVRQTLGWRDGKTGARKTSDWLTQRQLVKRTGRSSEAISRAIDALVRQRLLEVRGNSGSVLETPAQRRQTRGHIDYRLHPRLLSIPPAKERTHKSEYPTPALASPNSLLESKSRKSEYPTAAKANGTKENTKETLTKGAVLSAGTCPKHSTPADAFREDSSAVEEFLAQFRTGYHASGHGVPQEPEEGTIDKLSVLMCRYPSKELATLLDSFFRSDLRTIKNRRFSVEAFVDSIHLIRLFRRH